MTWPPQLQRIADRFPHPLVFASLSGAHLYGFASADSDWDLRGCHVLPIEEVVGLRTTKETSERAGTETGIDLDLVSHDIHKFCRLLLRPNGYVLEQLLSPLVVVTTPVHEELKALVPGLVARHHAHHYLGFAHNQWRMFERQPTGKTLLYVHRVLLTGIHLMRTGRIEASLPALLAEHPEDGVEELIARKVGGSERQGHESGKSDPYRARYLRLVAELESARDDSHLPDRPAAAAVTELHELVVRVRLGGGGV